MKRRTRVHHPPAPAQHLTTPRAIQSRRAARGWEAAMPEGDRHAVPVELLERQCATRPGLPPHSARPAGRGLFRIPLTVDRVHPEEHL